MFKVKGKKFRRVACNKDGSAPKGARKFKRGRSHRTVCGVPAKK